MVSYQVLSAQEWAGLHFGGVRLNDTRLTRRVVSVAAAMARDPSGSLPQQNKQWAATKGVYRLFDHERVTFESVSDAHWDQTRLSAGRCAVTLLIQDTTWLSYITHPATGGLGRHGRGERWEAGLGLFLHGVLAVEPQEDGSGRVLGLAWGKLWARQSEPVGKDNSRRSGRRCQDDLESLRWIEAARQIGAPPPERRWIHVGDREADLHDLYETTASMPGVGFVIRLKQQRNACAGHQQQPLTSSQRPKTKLKEVCRAMGELGQTQLWIAPKGNRPGRWAQLSVSGGPVTIYSPWYGRTGSRTGRPLCCWAVRVWEKNPPAGQEPIEWLLLASEPAENLDDALRLVGYYSLRWLIEEYHQCLKSGCKVEQRQLESADRLAPLIGMSAVLATRLLQLKNDARLTPERPAKECVPAQLLQTMAKLLKTDPEQLTIRQFTRAVAQRGGFLARKHDGEPGWLTLWRGWRELEMITFGFQLARETGRCG